MVPHDHLAFRLVYMKLQLDDESEIPRTICVLDFFLDFLVDEIDRLFRSGEASPYDVDLEGNTLLHVRQILLTISNH